MLVWGYIADLSMVPRLRRGRLAGRALSHPLYLAVKRMFPEKNRGWGPVYVLVLSPFIALGLCSSDAAVGVPPAFLAWRRLPYLIPMVLVVDLPIAVIAPRYPVAVVRRSGGPQLRLRKRK